MIGLANLIILAPVTEELIHRGYFQTNFGKRFGEIWGLVIGAFLFSLIHVPKLVFTDMINYFSLPLFFGLGLLFGFIYFDSESVGFAIGAHAIYNIVVIIL